MEMGPCSRRALGFLALCWVLFPLPHSSGESHFIFSFCASSFFWLQFDYLVVQMRPISCHLVILRVLISIVDIFSCTVYGFSKVRGVNLGGWLVVEGWIKTSLFDEIPNGDMLVSTAHVVVGFANLGFLVS